MAPKLFRHETIQFLHDSIWRDHCIKVLLKVRLFITFENVLLNCDEKIITLP